MFQSILMFLLAATASLSAQDTKTVVIGDVSPAAPKSASTTAGQDDSEDTGEVDEDIIITDEEDSNDDEGVSN